jgi:adenylate cyclase
MSAPDRPGRESSERSEKVSLIGPPLTALRACFEGEIPALLASCSLDGMPNVTYVSQVHYVDPGHVALSFQFFNKTRENVLQHPHAAAMIVDPVTGKRYRLQLHYLRTEESGPLFESMRARLAGIASHTGMAGVFRLRGSDVYRVTSIETVPGRSLPPPEARSSPLGLLRPLATRISTHTDLAALLDDTLAALEAELGITHSMLLLLDAGGRRPARLFMVASRGYDASGLGSEIPLGHGVIGVAAEQRTPIRISHFTAEYTYGRAIREEIRASGLAEQLESEIPLPGLASPRSQLAVPIVVTDQVVGVLYAESAEDRRFSFEHEDLLVGLAAQLGASIALLRLAAESHDTAPAEPAPASRPLGGAPVRVRHYPVNDSVFVDDEYVIKGVAGAILWKLAREFAAGRRTEFTNRELRLDPTLHLPDISDNLEARLILLARRLNERFPRLRIVKTGRGRFRFEADAPLRLEEAASA